MILQGRISVSLCSHALKLLFIAPRTIRVGSSERSKPRSSVCHYRSMSSRVRSSDTPGSWTRRPSPKTIPDTREDAFKDPVENLEDDIQGSPNWQRVDADGRGYMEESAGQMSLEPWVLCAADPSGRPHLAPFHIVRQVLDDALGDCDENNGNQEQGQCANYSSHNPPDGFVLFIFAASVGT